VPRDGKDYALIGIASAVAATGLLWLAGAAAAVLSGHRVPHHRPFGGVAALAHFGNPSLGWKTRVGPPVLYWTVTALLSLAAGTLVWLGSRLVKPTAMRRHGDDPTRVEGLATKGQVRQHAGPKALTARASTLRPSLARAAASDVGYRLGHASGVECWASVEDSILLLGPPRSGKGHNFVIPMILDSPGPVVSTSTRPDNLAITVAVRSKAHPVAVFDPQGLADARSLLPCLRWSPVRGCERPQTAMLRAALVADAGRSAVENANFWRQQTVSVVRCLLHAAAVDDRPAADLYRWSHGAAKAKEAVTILARDPTATPGWDSALDAIVAADPRTRDSIWAMVANTFASLADPAVLDAVTTARDDAFDPAPFLAEGGSLYLLGTASGASATANLVAAFVEDVTDTARRVAATSPGARLDPPLGLVLDEAANYPLPSLPALMAEGGGSGITTVAVLQSLAQARDRWGRDAAQAIWDAAIVKIVLGGSANADDLSNISRLIGDRDTREWSETYAHNGRSVSSTVRQRRILDPAALRRIGRGHGLLLLRAAPPIMLTLSPWTDRTDAAELVSARRRFEEDVQNPRGQSV
jgi:type IV secretory pathway TraG/TraD family ATPase VirD4